MKKQIGLMAFQLILAAGIQAQSDKYLSAMKDKLTTMEQTNTFEGWQQLGNGFERIADTEKTEWHPYYYASLCRVMSGYMLGNGQMGGFADKSDPEADKADELLAKAVALHGEDSETWCVRKMIATLRMSADPMNRFQTQGAKAAEALEMARKLDSSNPRIYLLEGQDKFFTPEQFGGSKTEAKALFEQCLLKFEAFRPASAIAPQWGRSQANYFLAQLK
jgi:hypothetical protein